MSRRARHWRLMLLCGLVPTAVVVPAGLHAQVPGAEAPRRQALEQQVLQRFVQRAMTEMALPASARPALVQVVRETSTERRRLNLEAVLLRRRLAGAVRDTGTSDPTFEQILLEMRQLREREHALWQREQERLRQILSPRQLAQFSLLWLRLQEDARALMLQRPAPPPPRQP